MANNGMMSLNKEEINRTLDKPYMFPWTRAEKLAELSGLSGISNEGPADALRHSLALAFLSDQIGEGAARLVGKANEMFDLKGSIKRIKEGKSKEEFRDYATEADLKANEVGLALANQTGDRREILNNLLGKMLSSTNQESFWGSGLANERLDPDTSVPWNRQHIKESPQDVQRNLLRFQGMLSP